LQDACDAAAAGPTQAVRMDASEQEHDKKHLKQLNQQLKEQQRGEELDRYAGQLAPFLSQLRDYALYILDPEGRIRSWNAGAERLKGYSAADILGQHFSIFYTPEERAANRPAEALALAARDGGFAEEGIRVRRDGTRFWASVVLSPLRDEQGTLQGYVKLARDISPRKISEAALRESEARYRALFEHSNDAILLMDPAGAILSANPAALQLFGYSERQMLALRREDIIDMSDPRVRLPRSPSSAAAASISTAACRPPCSRTRRATRWPA
jgi:PAS domain S-box-containing protein